MPESDLSRKTIKLIKSLDKFLEHIKKDAQAIQQAAEELRKKRDNKK